MIEKASPKALSKAVAFLKSGGVIICPTDTVYGLLADASNKKAVEKIYKIKNRPKSKPLSTFVKDLKMANGIAIIDEKQVRVLKKYWPGKYTFILERKPGKKFYGLDKKTVAIRIPKHAFLNNVLKKINMPLVQTSVNISDKNLLNKISDIMKQFSSQNILIMDGGDIKKAKSSKIIDLTQEKIKTLRR